MAEQLDVSDVPDEHRYEITLDGALAGYAAYRDEDRGATRVRVFPHTKVDPDFEGHGVGSALARGALDDVRASGNRIVTRCPFITAYVERHGEYAALRAPEATSS